MRILVVGSGGREHALVWKLRQEAEVFCTPGNAGIARECETFDVAAGDQAGLSSLAGRVQPDLVVVGPEDPLIAGLGDRLRAAGFAVLGPGADAARLEGSKAFAKDAMRRASVPTADFGTFTDAQAALEYARSRFDAGRQVAVKASGAALGKGVVVCSTWDEAEDAIGRMLVERELGDAGATIVVEDRLVGREFSLMTLVGESHWFSLPVAQDYKRALDGDHGPNTGGMGTYSPVGWLLPSVVEDAEERIVRPLVDLLARDGAGFRGVLFSGVMVQDGKPYCLEYNVRFGDPETQTVVRRLGSGFTPALLAAASGGEIPPVEVDGSAAVTVVLASKGYPGAYQKGHPIAIPALEPGVVVFHAGTSLQDGRLVSSGGRVLGISAVGSSVSSARGLAYRAASAIDAPGLRCRADIAADA